MEINSVNSASGGNYTQSTEPKVVKTEQTYNDVRTENIIGMVNGNSRPDNKNDKQEKDKEKKELNPDAVHKMSNEMNKFMRLLDSDIRFKIHEKTNTLIVQVVDSRDNTVLKEFPPHELLDTKAKIREYVGILLDRHA